MRKSKNVFMNDRKLSSKNLKFGDLTIIYYDRKLSIVFIVRIEGLLRSFWLGKGK